MRGSRLARPGALALGSGSGIVSVPAAPGPPSPLAGEAAIAQPAPGFVWVPGHSEWRDGAHAWIPERGSFLLDQAMSGSRATAWPVGPVRVDGCWSLR